MVIVWFLTFIGLFILGMLILRKGLFYLSGDSLKAWLLKVTGSPWKGFIVGIIITGLLQSSSAVMIITIGLISAGMLSFNQSIGIILGTNIGTTFTAEIITFDIESFLIPLVIIAILFLFSMNKKGQSVGLALLGISFVFMAMGGFESLAEPLRKFDLINGLLYSLNESYLLAVIAGAVITGIIQSSTATTGIIMGFLTSNAIELDSAIAVVLGSNIGTCVDALLAAIGSGKEARLTAYAHIWLNILGVLVFYPFIEELAQIGRQLAASPDVQLAHISVLFNVICSILVLPFANPFAKIILKLHS